MTNDFFSHLKNRWTFQEVIFIYHGYVSIIYIIRLFFQQFGLEMVSDCAESKIDSLSKQLKKIKKDHKTQVIVRNRDYQKAKFHTNLMQFKKEEFAFKTMENQTEIQRLNDQIECKEREKNDAIEKVRLDFVEKNEQQIVELNELSGQLEKCFSQTECLENECNRLKEETTELKVQIELLQKTLHEKEDSHSEEIRQLKEQIKSNEERYTCLESNNKDLEQMYNEKIDEIQNKNSNINSLNVEVFNFAEETRKQVR